MLGVAPLFIDGYGAEILCAALGAIIVLVIGAIWRRRSLNYAAQGTS
jgi:hypothetical protein